MVGDNIPLMARMTAVCDIYDAMVSRRSYKNPSSPFKVLSVISELRESDLDSMLVDIFISNMLDEMYGKQVVLTDGRVGTVLSIDPIMPEYPVIEVDGDIIHTNISLSCLSLYYDDEAAGQTGLI
jgi:HD-GYP domain-containing protein (c-di-GMP phosphodiesterase class II)